MQENHLRQFFAQSDNSLKNPTVIYEVQPQKPHRLCRFLINFLYTASQKKKLSYSFLIETCNGRCAHTEIYSNKAKGSIRQIQSYLPSKNPLAEPQHRNYRLDMKSTVKRTIGISKQQHIMQVGINNYDHPNKVTNSTIKKLINKLMEIQQKPTTKS